MLRTKFPKIKHCARCRWHRLLLQCKQTKELDIQRTFTWIEVVLSKKNALNLWLYSASIDLIAKYIACSACDILMNFKCAVKVWKSNSSNTLSTLMVPVMSLLILICCPVCKNACSLLQIQNYIPRLFQMKLNLIVNGGIVNSKCVRYFPLLKNVTFIPVLLQ